MKQVVCGCFAIIGAVSCYILAFSVVILGSVLVILSATQGATQGETLGAVFVFAMIATILTMIAWGLLEGSR